MAGEPLFFGFFDSVDRGAIGDGSIQMLLKCGYDVHYRINKLVIRLLKIGNQIVTNNNSHLYRESGRINLIKYMEEINGLIKELGMVVMAG